MKHNAAISLSLDMTERSRASEKQRRPTAVDDVMLRFAARQAEELGVDFKELLKELSSRSTEWRVRKEGATPQLLQKIDAKLDEIEQARGVKSLRAAKMKEWTELGAELLMLDDDGLHFRKVLAVAREALKAGRKLNDAIDEFHKK